MQFSLGPGQKKKKVEMTQIRSTSLGIDDLPFIPVFVCWKPKNEAHYPMLLSLFTATTRLF